MPTNCSSCGADLGDSAKFCSECGNRIDVDEVVVAVEEPPAASPDPVSDEEVSVEATSYPVTDAPAAPQSVEGGWYVPETSADPAAAGDSLAADLPPLQPSGDDTTPAEPVSGAWPPAEDPLAATAPGYDASAYDASGYGGEPAVSPPPSFDPPAYEPPTGSGYEAPAYEPPAMPGYEPPAYETPAYEPPAYEPPAAPSYPAPAYEPPAQEPPAYQPPTYPDAGYGDPGYADPGPAATGYAGGYATNGSAEAGANAYVPPAQPIADATPSWSDAQQAPPTYAYPPVQQPDAYGQQYAQPAQPVQPYADSTGAYTQVQPAYPAPAAATPTKKRGSGAAPLGGLLTLGGGALLIIGSFLDWGEALVNNERVVLTGFKNAVGNMWGGPATIALGAALVAFSLMYFRAAKTKRVPPAIKALTFVLAISALGFVAYLLVGLQLQDANALMGLWLCFLGAILAFAGSLFGRTSKPAASQ